MSTTTLTTAQLIPKERYISREWLDLEFERLWPRVWQFACRSEEIPNPGDFLEYTLGDQSVLLVRQPNGGVKGFHNACPHRGTQLASGRGTTSQFRCPFHGWSFAVDGTNTRVVDRDDFPCELVEPQAVCLSQCRVDTWGGFVWVNFDPAAPPLLDYLAPIPELAAFYRLDEMRLTAQRTVLVAANWKTVADAFLETYHVQGTHPTMAQYYDDTLFKVQPLGLHGRSGTFDLENAADLQVGRPSRRLGVGDDFDPKAVMVTMVREFAEANLFSGVDVDAAMQMVAGLEVPEGMSVGRFFAQMRRAMMVAQGIDTSAWSDDHLVTADSFLIFPNYFGPFNPGNMLLYRFRPHRRDPDQSYFDVCNLERFGPEITPPEVAYEFYDDWRQRDWGTLFSQDFENLQKIQAGMHARGFAGLRLCGQESLIANFHRALEHVMVPVEP